jgi:membrane-bound metal-dependent hydrolase YbcI (DUF457 family)
MPFTPFHFGPGLLIKGAAPKRFSWSTFVLTQVVIDCETLYNIVEHRYPLHRELHTFLGATLAGLATAAAVVGAKKILKKEWRLHDELATPGVWLGGLIGGASHPLLDGIMHSDIRPFLPWSAANPLHGAIGLGLLHLACVSAGIAGALLWARR